MRPAIVAALLALAASPAAAAPERAQAASGSRSSAPGRGSESLSLWGVLDPGPIDGVGVGGRFTIPIEPNGVLRHPRVKDEFTLEVGADFVHYSDTVGIPGFYVDYSWNGFLAVVGGTWNFWFTPRFALYPKLDVGYLFGWYGGDDDFGPYDAHEFDGIFVQGALGVIYRFQTMSLRAELGSGLLRLGVGFAF
jgi:hypothetical protein